jgi:hypothetical protein
MDGLGGEDAEVFACPVSSRRKCAGYGLPVYISLVGEGIAFFPEGAGGLMEAGACPEGYLMAMGLERKKTLKLVQTH